MPDSGRTQLEAESKLTIQEVNRVLEIGRLLLATLTPEEIGMLPALLARVLDDDVLSSNDELDNTHES